MTYIGGCVSKSRIAYCTDTTRIGPTSLFIRSTSSIHHVIKCVRSGHYTLWKLTLAVMYFNNVHVRNIIILVVRSL